MDTHTRLEVTMVMHIYIYIYILSAYSDITFSLHFGIQPTTINILILLNYTLFDFWSVILFFILTSQNNFSQHEDVKLSHTLIEMYLSVTAVLLLTLTGSKPLAITVNSEFDY